MYHIFMNTLDSIVSLCKRRGFIFPSSEIYGGFGGFWDRGPMGTALANNIKKLWWRRFVDEREDIYGLDAAIIMNPKTWEASGHTGPGFADPLRECKKCHHRFRGDDLKENKCPDCGGELTEEKKFNILVKTFIGPIEDKSTQAYLRGETCQGIFVNFKNILDVFHPGLPFGIAQIGKAFRNEITPGNFIFRSREFEQMEIEYFIAPDGDEQEYEKWKSECLEFVKSLGIKNEGLRFYEHPKEKLSHYSKGTTDIEYNFPFGWGEIWGIARRGDYDLTQHSKFSGQDLSYVNLVNGEKCLPWVVEPSVGVDRLMLSVLCDAYEEQVMDNGKKRVVLHLAPNIAPVQIAVFPLVSNKENIAAKAKEVYGLLRKKYVTLYDGVSNIGKRYRRQDEIGTPYCVTIDYQTLEDGSVTVRDRDSMGQERVGIDRLNEYLTNIFNF